MIDTLRIFKAAGLRFGSDGCAFFAQALAFNAVFAVFPILILTVATLAFVFGGTAAEADTRALIATLAPAVQEILYESVQQVVALRGLSGALAIVALIWSGKNLFQGLAYALNRALGVPDGRPLVADILVALVMLPIIGVLFIVATIVPLAITFVVSLGGFRNAALFTQIVGYGTGVVLIFAIAMVLYTYLPNRKVGPTFAIPGAIFVTFAWEIAQVAFAIYTTHVDFRHVYGALAALALLMVWFYYMASIFLFGAELSAQWSERAV
ncbi:MAG: YihY/virulence factor BrkB family protein [Vulcanimicrobiaceae bacterium]